MVEFAYFVRRAAEAATPWLVGSAIGFLVLWLVLLCRQKKAFAKLSAWFGALTPFGKLMAVAVVCLCTLWGGTKEGGDRGGGEEVSRRGTEARSAGGHGGMRGLPPELAAMSNALAITDFAVDPLNKAVAFEAMWASNLFDYTDSRDLHLFSSTNLQENRWMPLGAFEMPPDTNAWAFTVTTNDVALSSLRWFLDALNGVGFYRFGIDLDSDGDGLIDSFETLWAHTAPDNPDTDGDGLNDGNEIAHGTNPFSADTDGDGLPDGEEIAVGVQCGWMRSWKPGERFHSLTWPQQPGFPADGLTIRY